MEHKFNAKSKNKLDSPRRREILPPFKVLAEVELKEGNTLVDVGAGIGYFSIPAAEIVGTKGKVYALDISLEMLEDIDKKAKVNELKNIRTVVTEEYNLKVENDLADMALICTVLHEVEDINRFIGEVKRLLKVDGKIVVVEWKKQEMDMGPPLDHRLDVNTVESVLVENCFKSLSSKNIGEHFYCVTAIK
jgi:ubiquinone/menaquinone biosynthesis C-methylase UbiE